MHNIKWKLLNKLLAAQLRVVVSTLIHFNFFGFKKDIKKIETAHSCRHQWKSLSHFIDILIVGEDRRFYDHDGIDLCGILRAIWVRIHKGSIQGASTIEQQLVRVIIGNYTIKLSRKIREILLSSYLRKIMSKNDIACLYLEIAYFGAGMKGLKAVCKKLGILHNKATINDAVEVVARLKYPEPSNRNLFRTAQINRRVEHIFSQYSIQQKQNCVYNNRIQADTKNRRFFVPTRNVSVGFLRS